VLDLLSINILIGLWQGFLYFVISSGVLRLDVGGIQQCCEVKSKSGLKTTC